MYTSIIVCFLSSVGYIHRQILCNLNLAFRCIVIAIILNIMDKTRTKFFFFGEPEKHTCGPCYDAMWRWQFFFAFLNRKQKQELKRILKSNISREPRRFIWSQALHSTRRPGVPPQNNKLRPLGTQLTILATRSLRWRPYFATTGRRTSVTGLVGLAFRPTERLMGTRSNLPRGREERGEGKVNKYRFYLVVIYVCIYVYIAAMIPIIDIDLFFFLLLIHLNSNEWI